MRPDQPTLQPIAEMPDEVAASIRFVLVDIDDTLTTDGRLTASAYAALEALHDAGLSIAPVTGRPAGWCDMVARFWPVSGVIGENGAFYFSYDPHTQRMIRAHAVDEGVRRQQADKLNEIRKRVLAEVPGAAVSADQPFRMVDLAIDFCEDVPRLPDDAVARIKQIFEEAGAVAKISSIHVNGWFGDHDKLTMTRRFADEILGLNLERDEAAVVYCGDSPNDAPMFGYFTNGCGVANVRDFIGRLDAEPRWIASARGGAGFVEIAERILAARR